jgi:hypothetical protein
VALVYDAKPLLVPLLVTFVVALGVAAFAPVASAALFFGGSFLIIGYGHLKERKLRRLHQPPVPQLPRATLLDD